MKLKSSVFVAIVLAMVTAGAHAAVTVTFTNPDKYADVPFAAQDKQEMMTELQRHFEKLGAQLPVGQDLKIEVLDIDLAGRIEPSARATRDLRIIRGSADWPVITVRYSLESQGKVLKTGEERIADQNYTTGFNHYSSSESLRYEKQMLDRWFKKTFLPDKPGT
jgi:hypothetical protein